MDRLLAQNTIRLVDKCLLNIKLHLPTWQQLTVCEISVNPDQRFCFRMPCAYCAMAAAHVWLGRTCAVANCQQQHQHGANIAGLADGSNMILYLSLFSMTWWVNDIKLEICFLCIKTSHVMVLDRRYICVKLVWLETSNEANCHDRWEGPYGESLPVNTWKHRGMRTVRSIGYGLILGTS